MAEPEDPRRRDGGWVRRSSRYLFESRWHHRLRQRG